MHEELIARAGEIIAQNSGQGTHCVLALQDLDGTPTASTITVSKGNGIRWLTFCTGFGTRTERIARCDRASICFSSEEYNITLTGRITVETEAACKREMWYEGLSNHFSGAEDPGYCVLRFQTERYNLLIDWKEVQGIL